MEKIRFNFKIKWLCALHIENYLENIMWTSEAENMSL